MFLLVEEVIDECHTVRSDEGGVLLPLVNLGISSGLKGTRPGAGRHSS